MVLSDHAFAFRAPGPLDAASRCLSAFFFWLFRLPPNTSRASSTMRVDAEPVEEPLVALGVDGLRQLTLGLLGLAVETGVLVRQRRRSRIAASASGSGAPG
jgi:hypothetical protein